MVTKHAVTVPLIKGRLNSELLEISLVESLKHDFYIVGPTDLFHRGDQIKYSLVLMLISLSNLAAKGKFKRIFQPN